MDAHTLDMLDVTQRATVEAGMIRIVRRSFAVDVIRAEKALVKPQPPTRSEVRRRTRILYDWLAVMRNDLGYSIPRCLDVLADALRAELDGLDYTPAPAARGWAPSKE